MKHSHLPAWLTRLFPRANQTPAELRATAERQGPDAQNNLGIIYLASERHDDNDQSAAACFHAAADRGYAPAQYNLALLYERGHGVPRNPEQARAWFLRAAEQGHSTAQFHLGLQSHRKSLDRANTLDGEFQVEALKWVLLAAEHAHHNAETLCGSLILEMTHEQVTESTRRAATFKSFFA